MSDKEKIKALLEGLEIQHIDTFMISSTVGDYRKLGQAYAKKAFEALKIAKRFEGAVELYVPNKKVAITDGQIFFVKPETMRTHTVYAIPKENE